MQTYEFFTIIGMLAAGFAWIIIWLKSIDHRLNDLETRVTVIETILSMMGSPMNTFRKKTDP